MWTPSGADEEWQVTQVLRPLREDDVTEVIGTSGKVAAGMSRAKTSFPLAAAWRLPSLPVPADG